MNTEQTHCVEEFSRAVSRQIQLLEEFTQLEETLPDIVKKLEWNDVEKRIHCMEQTAGAIESIELEVERILSNLTESSSVNELLSILPKNAAVENEKLLNRRREAFFRVKDTTMRLGYYFGSLSKTLGSVLEEFIPETKGNVYSKDGIGKTTLDNVRILDSTI